MSFLDRITALIPVGRKKETLEYFFALNIGHESINCALWTIENKHLKILQTSSANYSSIDDLIPVTDKLLDEVLGIRELEPQKILFGVPSSWLVDENLKMEKIKILKTLVKELELTPMAYVESSHALIHFLEKTEGIPPTAILVGFEPHHLTVTVVRAGKLDGVKVISRGENSGTDIEKALLTFTGVETLPSKILIYGLETPQLKNGLLSYPWMSKLSFLHFPKIDTLPEEIEIKSTCFAGASEIEENVSYIEKPITSTLAKSPKIFQEEKELKPENSSENSGFVVGDVATQEEESADEGTLKEEEELKLPAQDLTLVDDFENEPLKEESNLGPVESSLKGVEAVTNQFRKFSFKKFFPKSAKNRTVVIGILGVIFLLLISYLILPKAEIKIFVEPKILEKDTTVTADPNQKTVDEDNKIIPGQIVETQVSGTSKAQATGQKEVGNPSHGTIVIYNKTFENKSLSRGIVVTSASNLKFTLDTSVTIASQSATDSGITFGKASTTVTASAVGADSNLPSGSDLNIAGFTNQQISGKAEGNFSGGSSKQVTVVSSDDQNKLLASLASSLRKDAQQQLQEKLPQKKILEESLAEEIVKKSFNKNINDQANEFSLNLTSKYKGTAFEDKDLKSIVSKLVVTQVPEGFKLNLEDTETQADVSKVDKLGKLIFLAKFKAKLMPKIDTEKIKRDIRGKSVNDAVKLIKSMENVLGVEVKISPAIPLLQRIPILTQNIKVEVGLK